MALKRKIPKTFAGVTFVIALTFTAIAFLLPVGNSKNQINDNNSRPPHLLKDDNVADWYRYLASLRDVFSDDPNATADFLVILVASSPENFSRREAIRKTWSSGATWASIFLIGQTSTQHVDRLIDAESRNNGDVLRGSYSDTYRNLTLKVLHGLFFLSDNPPRFVLKTDDDCFVNSLLLTRILERARDGVLYAGNLQRSLRVIRKPSSKWFVSVEDYRSSRYPSYASGIGYVLSGSLLKRLKEASALVRPFPNEDAYVGVVMSKMGVVPVHNARFSLGSRYGGLRLCNYAYVVVVHRVPSEVQLALHRKALKALETCDSRIANCEFQSACSHSNLQ